MTTAGEPWLLDVEDVAGNYVERLASSPDAQRGSFGSYRAIDKNDAQNQQRNTRRLTLPVLAVATPFLALTGAPPCDELLNVDTGAGFIGARL